MKELHRSRTNRMIAGVCGGIGEYFGIDPNVVRLVWVIVTAFTMGIGLLAYLIAWLILPEEGSPAAASSAGTPAGAGPVLEVDPDR
jgi:phage shock protein C